MTTSTEIKRAKRALRREVLARRDALPADDRAQRSTLIAERIVSLPEFVGTSVLLAYWAFGSEVDLGPLFDVLRGVVVALPKVVGPHIVPVTYAPGDPLASTPLGPREPVLGDPLDTSRIEVVLTPGVAFDRAGGRLGYGGGYYDRFFPTIAADVPRIGVAFSTQIVEAVPRGGSDRPVGLIVTEDEVIRPA